MTKLILPLASLALVVAACGNEADFNADGSSASAALSDDAGPPIHAHARKDAHTASGGGGKPVLLMTNHGGPVLTANKTMAIFWGSEWSDGVFAGDKVTGADSFFQGFGGSNYAGASTEYVGNNGQVTRSSTYLGHTFDTSAAPKTALSTSAVIAEACSVAGNSPDPATVYFVYTSTGAGNVNYCAYHTWGTCSNGAPIQAAYMPNIDGLAGCDPVDTSNGHSQGLAALMNVTAHELSEAITDPRGNAWFDRNGAENGDKCAWTFTGNVTLSNGTSWKLQQEWSNNAANAGAGSPRGCIQG
jgi:hypothetical protein